MRWDEMVYYVQSQAGWLQATFRVGGDIALLKRILAYALLVIVVKVNDIPACVAADQFVAYSKLDAYWQSFNRLYILVYPPEAQAKVQALLGPDADESSNH